MAQPKKVVYLNPTNASPAQIISGSVKCDIQGVEVAGLPVKEFQLE